MFSGKTALVTGAGSGLGRATAVHLARQGATVFASGRTLEPLEKLALEMSAEGHKVIAVRADVTDPADMQSLKDQISAVGGGLDILFVNAGINGVWTPIEDMDIEEWDHTLAVNLRGTFLTVHKAIPLMRERGGSIIITSSINGTRTFTTAGASAYAASKAGQVAFAKMAALELAGSAIRVNVICPGHIESEIHDNPKRGTERVEIPVEFPQGDIPLTGGNAGKPEDVAELVAFLASDASRHITGTTVFIDGGQSLLR